MQKLYRMKKLLHRLKCYFWQIAVFCLISLYLLHQGGFLIKIWSALKLAAAGAIPTWIFIKITGWTVTNSEYVAGVLLCIAVDHIIGSIYHFWKLRDFTIKKNATGLLVKLGMCAASVLLFEVIHNTIIEVEFIYDYLKITTRLVVILYPAGSAFMNMSALTDGVFPPIGWINRIKNFNTNLDLNNLKTEVQEQECIKDKEEL